MLFLAIITGFSIANYDIIKRVKFGELEIEAFQRKVDSITENALRNIKKEVDAQNESIAKLITESKKTRDGLEKTNLITESLSVKQSAIERRVARIEKDKKIELSRQYNSYIVLGLSGNKIIPPTGLPEGLRIDWKNAKIIKVDDDKIEMMLPDMEYKNNKFIKPTVILPKKPGYKKKLFKIHDLEVEIDVLAVEKDLVVIAIGFIKS